MKNPKSYKCRCTDRTKKWIEIFGETPEEAAEIYAEECYVHQGGFVTVMGVGRFVIYEETIYSALKQKECPKS